MSKRKLNSYRCHKSSIHFHKSA